MKLAVVFALLVCLFILHNCIAIKYKAKGRGKRNQLAIADVIYNALIKIIEGDPLPPVKQRTKVQRSAAVRYCIYKGEIKVVEENGQKVLYSKGRRILRVSEIRKVVTEEFIRTKGSGAAKLVCSLKQNFAGLSRVRVQEILNTDKLHYKRNAKFCNKATLKPIRARDVHIRHQIDLMDMGKRGIVKLNGETYRYVLSVIDVFSRFLWLRAIGTKCSKTVAKELQSIYLEHRTPRVIQCD